MLFALRSRDTVSFSIQPIQAPGTGAHRQHYLLASACKSSQSKPCAGGMVYWPDPAIPFQVRENKGSENTQSLRKGE